MNEEALKLLSTDQLLAQMIRLTNEVVDMHRQANDKQIIKEKLKEIQLIQAFIVARRTKEHPGK
ncbi:MAG: hypothetical protein ACXWV8_13600 [Chitinophagaceae bacterium]